MENYRNKSCSIVAGGYSVLAKLRRLKSVFYLLVFGGLFGCVLVVENILQYSIHEDQISSIGNVPRTKLTQISPFSDMSYERCTHIPEHPHGAVWPEEAYIHDPKPSNLSDLADPKLSRVWVAGNTEVRVGDTLVIKIELYDGHGKRKQKGGDLVRVWIKEPALGASAAARVTDNRDGSYSALVTAFWEGRPKVMAAIISPREVIALQFRRRYICPPLLMNTAKFVHHPNGSQEDLVEETPCNYDPQVAGYDVLCNLTGDNYGSPWYCGKPRIDGLLCDHWTIDSGRNLWDLRQEQKLLSSLEKIMVDPKYKAMIIPSNLSLNVQRDLSNQSFYQSKQKCNSVSKALSWDRSLPTGYLFNRKWTSRHCFGQLDKASQINCLKNTKFIIIGDSTCVQIYHSLKTRLVCNEQDAGKHRYAICVNTTLNFSMISRMHGLPFCTADTPRIYIKPLTEYMDDVQPGVRNVLIIHMYAHFLNHHSHVYYETIRRLKKSIIDILESFPNIYVVVKGPHTYSFAPSEGTVMWMPDKYADDYHDMLYNTFSDLSDRVLYLECHEITVATEQWHIHAETYVIDALVDKLLSHICQY